MASASTVHTPSWRALSRAAACVLSALVTLSCAGSSPPAGEAGASGGAGAAGSDGGGGAAGGAGSAGGGAYGSPDAVWTVLVYAHADHNLSPSLFADLDEMSHATLDPRVQVLVVADWNASAKLPGGDGYFPTGTEWLRIRGGGQPAERIELGDEKNFDDPEVLARVVSDGFSRFPAPRRALVLWDHGGSWNKGFGGDHNDGKKVGSSVKPMSLVDLASALDNGVKGAGLSGDRPLDLLGIDACLMGGVEVAYALRHLAPVYIGSAEIDYGNGWDYQSFLGSLSASPDASAVDLAKGEVASWGAHHQGQIDDRYLKAQVALDTTKLEALAGQVKAFGEAFVPFADALSPELSRLVLFANPGYGGSVSKTTLRSGYADLKQLLQGTSAPAFASLAGASAAATAAFDEVVIASSLGELRAGQGALHVGTPGPDDPVAFFQTYPQLAGEWDTASGWSKLLLEVAKRHDTAPPDLALSLEGQGAPSPASPFLLHVKTTSPDAFGGFVELWSVDEQGKRESQGLVGGLLLRPGEDSVVPWTGVVHDLGEQGERGYATPWMLSWEGQTSAPSHVMVSVPGQLEQPGEETRAARLLFVVGNAEATSLLVDDGGLTRAFDATRVASLFPGSAFHPERLFEIAKGQTQTEAGGAVPFEGGKGPVAAPRVLPAGNYLLKVRAQDVWGNTTEQEIEAAISG